MTNTLRNFITEVDKAAVVIFNAKGVIYPMWHVVTKTGQHQIVPSPPTDDKDLAAVLMRAFFEIVNVTRYVFVDEAWQLELRGGDMDLAREVGRHGIAHHPGRVEVLMYQAEDETGAMSGRRIITRKNGKPKLGPLELEQYPVSEGRLVGMLPQRGVMQ